MRMMIRRVGQRLGRRVVYGVPAAMFVASLAAAWITGSSWLLMSALVLLTALLALTVRDSRVNRIMIHDLRWWLNKYATRVRALEQRVARITSQVSPPKDGVKTLHGRVSELERELHRTRQLLVLNLLDGGVPVEKAAHRLPPDMVPMAVSILLERGDILDAHTLATATGALTSLRTATLRHLRKELRSRGYLPRALEVARLIERTGGNERDVLARKRIAGDIAVLSGSFELTVRAQTEDFEPIPGRVLHLVGRSLPEDQVGYTLRTHYIATSQRAAGLDPHVVTQMGVSHEGEDYAAEELDGITYHRVPGPRRGQEPFDRWLGAHAQRVANLVRVVRPTVLHAASDFVNALTAIAVGKALHIPVVYESRGFWEETWLSRTAAQYGWDLEALKETYGLPDAYMWRRALEDHARQHVDRVVTLDPVMADRIEAGGVPRERITIVPNGVEVENFPVVDRDEKLAADLGITPDVTTVGYISSLTEYEGIDTLISAYDKLKRTCSTPVRLVIVGDGPVREQLTKQAGELGLDEVIFTGRVPHDAVLDYYSMIDVFVVPRRPVEVCHLVTPLKPFEAFATGRAVVLSNVRALAAIAEQSGAAELFEAGNAESLAAVLQDLITKPERRRDLAAVGAKWVRGSRTWDAYARRYIRAYEDVGALKRGPYSIPLLSVDDIDVEKLRQVLEHRPLIPFESLSSEDMRRNADELMRRGWKLPPHPPVTLDPPLDWTTLCIENRSWSFRLHSWDFMGRVLRAYEETGDRRYLDWCVERAVSWAEQFNEGDAQGTMAWYDMALGLRGHRLAYLTEWAIRVGSGSKTISTLLKCVIRHQQEYYRDDVFNPRSNHGLYLALGQLALCRRLRGLPGMDVLEDQAGDRLSHMTNSQFLPDGGHVEHSPEYHRMVLSTLSNAVKDGLVDDDEVRARIARAEDVLGWFVQPNGEMVQVGDSFARNMLRGLHRTSSPTTDFIVSRGERGRPDDRSLLTLPATGYAVVRSPQPRATDDHEHAAYLFLAAGFHSRTHKHADDLAITWYDRGMEILIDAGRYGYLDPLPKDSPLREQGFFYSASERQYVESTRAHNTAEVDGVDQERRGRRPYGSALVDTQEKDGYFRLVAEVDHGHWRHHRDIVLLPGQWLYVVDSVHSQDRSKHTYRVWWNLPHDMTMTPGEESRFYADWEDRSERLEVAELSGARLIPPVSGQRDPVMRGWRSKQDLQVTPAWSTGYEVTRMPNFVFRTLFRLDGGPMIEPVHPFDGPEVD
jgi:glycosyltransferase involved in cell wall biosynthesis